jgi:hypothetical protein
MNKFKALILTAWAVAVFGVVGYATRGDIMALHGEGVLRGIEVWRITSTGDIKISSTSSHTNLDFDADSGAIRLGGAAATSVSAAFPSVQVLFVNGAAASIPRGSIVVATTAMTSDKFQNGSIVAAIATTTVLGVASADVASGAVGYMTVAGYALALTTGIVNIGDVLITTSPTGGPKGYASVTFSTVTWSNPRSDFGIAVATGNPAGGLTLIKLP